MSGIKFTPNHDGFRALETGPEATGLIRDATETLADRCGDGFRPYVSVTGRARGYVDSDTMAARIRQLKSHVVEKALGQGIGL